MNWNKIARRIRVPLGFVLAAVFLWLAHPTPLSLAAGLIFVALGLWTRGYASGYVRKNEELATTGPYARCRNPLYLGSIVIAMGFAAASLRWEIGVAMLLMFVAIYLPVIRDEEAWLRGHFADFDAYCARTPRLLPRLIAPKEAHDESAGFSRALYCKHREYNALIGSLALAAALLGKILWLGR